MSDIVYPKTLFVGEETPPVELPHVNDAWVLPCVSVVFKGAFKTACGYELRYEMLPEPQPDVIVDAGGCSDV